MVSEEERGDQRHPILQSYATLGMGPYVTNCMNAVGRVVHQSLKTNSGKHFFLCNVDCTRLGGGGTEPCRDIPEVCTLQYFDIYRV